MQNLKISLTEIITKGALVTPIPGHDSAVLACNGYVMRSWKYEALKIKILNHLFHLRYITQMLKNYNVGKDLDMDE